MEKNRHPIDWPLGQTIKRRLIETTASTLVALLLLGVAACQPKPRVATVPLAVDRDKGTITLNVKEVPLSAVLTSLRTEAGIQVVVPDLQDRRVSIAVTNQPLAEVIQRLVGADTRYWIVVDKGELTLPGDTKDKPGRVQETPRNLPRKGARDLPPIDPTAPRKVSPDEVQQVKTDGSGGTKMPPRTEQVAPPRERKRALDPPTPKGSYARLRFRMTDDRIASEHAIILPGQYISDVSLIGEYVYAVKVSGRVIEVGSFRDPLEVHSYFLDEKRPHELLRAKSGTFNISLPEQALTREALGTLLVEIYRLVDTAPTVELSPETFPKFRDALKQQSAFSGKELIERFPNLGVN